MKSNVGMFSLWLFLMKRAFTSFAQMRSTACPIFLGGKKSHFLSHWHDCLWFVFRLELQREREKQKEAEVEALKRSMQSGMVRIMFMLTTCIWYLLSVICYLNLIMCGIVGASNERTSTTKRRDELLVQNRQHWGGYSILYIEKENLNLFAMCVLKCLSGLFCCYVYRQRVLFKDDWILIFRCDLCWEAIFYI